jgi:adenylylsulfate kinase
MSPASAPAPVSQHLTWHPGKLTEEERASRLGQKGAVVWLTGLSGSGKSTLAREVELALVRNGRHAAVLDGDNIRHGLNRDLGFSPKDRAENIRRIGEVATLFSEANVIVLTAFISPYRADRDEVRALLKAGRFLEVHLAATLEACEARDAKGLYRKAREGRIPEFTGISAPYEAPEKAELVLDTGTETLEQSTRRVLDLLKGKGIG